MTISFLQWLYLDAPEEYWHVLRDLLLGLYHYFSIGLLASTLIAPWRKDSVALSRLPVGLWFGALVSNITSRAIGFFVRCCVILAGGAIITLAGLGGVIFILGWYLLPLLLLFSIVYGVMLIGRGL